MKDTNIVVLVGRLTRDPEQRFSQSGLFILNFSIACNRSVKDPMSGEYKDEASFFDISYFGKGAEAVSKYLAKGKQVSVSGELVQDRWEKDGVKQSKVKINANSVQLLGSKQDDAAEPAHYTEKPQAKTTQKTNPQDGFIDEIPF